MQISFLGQRNFQLTNNYNKSNNLKKTRSIIATTIPNFVLFVIRLGLFLKNRLFAKRPPDKVEVDIWNYNQIDKNISKYLTSLKYFMNGISGNLVDNVFTEKLYKVQAKKVSNQSKN